MGGPVGVGCGDLVADGDGEPVGNGGCVAMGVGEGGSVPMPDGDGDAVGVGDGEPLGEGAGDLVGDGDRIGDSDAGTVGAGDGGRALAAAWPLDRTARTIPAAAALGEITEFGRSAGPCGSRSPAR